MSERGKSTCSCERCGNYCHQQQSHCDPCQEVRRLREALGAMLSREADPRITVSALDDQRIVDAARQALKETPRRRS